MKRREIKRLIQGKKAIDGAGVHLVRVLGLSNVDEFDPFLMLDSFDSKNPSDYIAGFPMHPHRGIETITYLISGEIDHEDSLGNKGTINSGESQWMTAGSGILHQEMPKVSDKMLGFQLWLNLPKDEKMSEPAYLSITNDMIPLIKSDNAQIRILAGTFGEVSGVTSSHIPATIYDVILPKGEDIRIFVNSKETVFVFFIEGDGIINGQKVFSKTAVLFEEGDYVELTAATEADLRFILFSAMALNEPIAWGGPIVMNTQEELNLAFNELERGTFIKHK